MMSLRTPPPTPAAVNPDPADRSHPDFLRACELARTTAEQCFLTARTLERAAARRAVTCHLLNLAWKPVRIARLFNVHRKKVVEWASRCPVSTNRDAWRPPAGTSGTSYGRKLRRWREQPR